MDRSRSSRVGQNRIAQLLKSNSVVIYDTLSILLRAVPPGALGFISALGGAAGYLLSPFKRSTVADNLSRVAGSPRPRRLAALVGYVSYTRYWVEALSMGRLDRRDLDARMSFYGFEHVYKALGMGKGAIITSPHLGNWDFGAAWFASKGHPITAVMEALEPRELFDWFADHRIKYGVTAIPGSSLAFTELTKALARNELVALVADRDLLGSGVSVSFFGEETLVPQGVALLALRTGAPIIPTAIYMLPGGQHLAYAMEPIIAQRSGLLKDDVCRLTERVVASYEEFIRADPTQWHLFQPNWPSQLETGST